MSISIALLLFATAHSSAQDNASGPAAAVTPTIPTYPDKPTGLEQLAKDILKAIKQGDRARVDALLASLVLPQPAKWYSEVFGGYTSEKLAQNYEQKGSTFPSRLGESFQKMVQERATDPIARKHETSCDDDAGELIYPVLMARLKPVPLYELRFFSGKRFFRLWAFAYVEGGFRYVENLRPPESLHPPEPGEVLRRIKLGRNVAAAKLVHRVQPEYPRIAIDVRLEGTVRLHALIGKDGLVRDLRVSRGYCSLAQAALKAVRQWRYAPTLLNGEPAEVDTTIDVTFALKR